MADEPIAEIRARHTVLRISTDDPFGGDPVVNVMCSHDGQRWPCDTAALLAELAAVTVERDGLRERLDWQRHKRGQVEADREALARELGAVREAGDALADAVDAGLGYAPMKAAADRYRALAPAAVDGGAGDAT